MGVEIKVGESFKEVADRTPTGAVLAYAGETAPTGWLVCDGSQVSRTTYADLFAVVGTAFGSGDGVNTFHLPDLRGQFIRGWANGSAQDPDRATRTAMATGGATGDSIGSVQNGAMLTHTHSIAHDHAAFTSAAGSSHSHGAGSYAASGDGAHGHDSMDIVTGVGSIDGPAKGTGASWVGSDTRTDLIDTTNSEHSHTVSGTGGAEAAHTHSINPPNYTGNSGNPSAGGGNETRPLNAYLNYIIKY